MMIKLKRFVYYKITDFDKNGNITYFISDTRYHAICFENVNRKGERVTKIASVNTPFKKISNNIVDRNNKSSRTYTMKNATAHKLSILLGQLGLGYNYPVTDLQGAWEIIEGGETVL